MEEVKEILDLKFDGKYTAKDNQTVQLVGLPIPISVSFKPENNFLTVESEKMIDPRKAAHYMEMTIKINNESPFGIYYIMENKAVFRSSISIPNKKNIQMVLDKLLSTHLDPSAFALLD